jgi:hypothetical protein
MISVVKLKRKKKFGGFINSKLETFSTSSCIKSHRLIGLDSTEVGRAFLIHFQKIFLNKVFLMLKIARELKSYTRMVTSGIFPKKVQKFQENLTQKCHF